MTWWDRRSKKLIVTVLAVAVPVVNRRFNLGLTDAEVIAIVAALMAWVGSRALVEALGGIERHEEHKPGTPMSLGQAVAARRRARTRTDD